MRDSDFYHEDFFAKNDTMLPCPGFAPGLGLGALTAGFFLAGGSSGSSSENDSQVGSSTVTSSVGMC